MAAKRKKNDKKSDKETTAKRRIKFLAVLSECGNVTKSADEAGLNRQFLYNYRDKNPDFAAAWEKCAERGYEALLDEAIRRVREGVEEPVFYKGEEVARVMRFSDSLLSSLLTGLRPRNFGLQKIEANHTADETFAGFFASIAAGTDGSQKGT